MSWLRALLVRLGFQGDYKRIEREIDEEVEFHLAMRTESNTAAGMEPREARAEAELRFGDVDHIRHVGSRIRAGSPPSPPRPGTMDTLRQDLRFGLRSLLRTPLVSLAAVVSLALGIGATSAMFAAFDVWLLRPMPVHEADRVVRVWMANRDEGWTTNPFTVRDFVEWREASEAVDLAVYASRAASFTAGDEARRESVLQGSWNLLPVLGVVPSLGRGFLPEEEMRDTPRVVILSDGFWRSAMGEDPHILGQTVILDGDSYTVVGVLPPDPQLPQFRASLWIPLRRTGDEPRIGHSFWGLGRLREGVSLEQARENLQNVASVVALNDPNTTLPDATVVPLKEIVYGPIFRRGSTAIGAAVLFVLLIACANIANLLLARGIGRHHEMAVRGAVGASRSRLVRQLFTESVLLACIGGVAGIATAFVGIRLLLTHVLTPDMPGWHQIGLDHRVVAATVVITLASAVLFGLMPALVSSRVDLRNPLQEGGRGRLGGRRNRLGQTLIVNEVALALALLVSSGLITKSLVVLHRVDLGFRTENLLTFWVSPPFTSYPELSDVAAFHRAFEERIAAVPGVSRVGMTSSSPVGYGSTTLYTVPGGAGGGARARHSAQIRSINSAYLELMELELLAGRLLDERIDLPEATEVALVSRPLAERHWGSAGEALGRVLNGGPRETGGGEGGSPVVIVGVVDIGHAIGPGEPPPPMILQLTSQRSSRSRAYVLDTEVDAAPLVAALRRELRSLDPAVALWSVRTVEELVRDGYGNQEAALRLFFTLALLAIVLTLVGVYGVMSHQVNVRTREMGLRIALGAERREVVGHVMGQSGRVVAIGLALGLALSLAAGPVISFMLVGVSPYDPGVLLGVSALTLFAALLASYLPARRASLVDPVRALGAD